MLTDPENGIFWVFVYFAKYSTSMKGLMKHILFVYFLTVVLARLGEYNLRYWRGYQALLYYTVLV